MIFLTVGVQLPFDRLVRAVDDWAEQQNRSDVVAQIGVTTFQPKRLDARATLTPDDFRRLVEDAELVIAHAGMGSIITALELGKKIIVMPRRAELGEHRNDHQLATAAHMAEQKTISVAQDEAELLKLLTELEKSPESERINPHASDDLISTIAEQISQAPVRSRGGFWPKRT